MHKKLNEYMSRIRHKRPVIPFLLIVVTQEK